jgi:hypothetical protein
MSRGVNAQDGYLEALVKNMPSETVAAYLAIMGLMAGMKDAPTWLLWLVWVLLLVTTPFYLWLVKPKNDTEKRPWWQIWLFSPIAFFAWSMTMGGPWASVDQAALIGSVLIVLLTALLFPLASMAIYKLSS